MIKKITFFVLCAMYASGTFSMQNQMANQASQANFYLRKGDVAKAVNLYEEIIKNAKSNKIKAVIYSKYVLSCMYMNALPPIVYTPDKKILNKIIMGIVKKVKLQPVLAIQYLTEVAERKKDDDLKLLANMQLGETYNDTRTVEGHIEKDHKKAVTFFKNVIKVFKNISYKEKNFLFAAQYKIGQMYYFGECGIEKNRDEAKKYYCLAAQHKNNELSPSNILSKCSVLLNLGVLHKDSNPVESYKYYKRVLRIIEEKRGRLVFTPLGGARIVPCLNINNIEMFACQNIVALYREKKIKKNKEEMLYYTEKAKALKDERYNKKDFFDRRKGSEERMAQGNQILSQIDRWHEKFLCFNCKKKDLKAKLCSKCKVARYCSKTCQIDDWKKGHKKTCKLLVKQQKECKKMEDPSEGEVQEALETMESLGGSLPEILQLLGVLNKEVKENKSVCSNCSKNASKVRLCSRCKCVQYCSKACQAEDWKKKHKKECKFLAEGKIKFVSKEDK